MYKNKLNIVFLLIYVLSCCIFINSFTQENTESDEESLNKEVFIVKEYKPSVSDASKLNDMPSMDDSIAKKPSIEYFMTPREVNVDYKLRPFKAARMVGLPLTKLYPHYARIGFANYATPMIDIYTSSLRSKDFTWSANLVHESSWGKIKLMNNEKTKAHYHDTYFNINGKKIFDNNELTANLDFSNNSYLFYGVNTKLDSLPDKNDIKQSVYRISPGLKLKSLNYKDTTRWNYLLAGNYELVSDKYSFAENNFIVDADLDKYVKDNKLGLEGNLHSIIDDSSSTSYISVKPYLSRWGDEWIVHAGINITVHSYQGNSDLYYHPIGYIEYIVGQHYFDPFAGVSGRLRKNSYSQVLDENPWVIPGLDIKTGNNILNLYGGFKGNFSSKLSYNFRLEYSILEDWAMYVNDTNTVFNNQFNVVYDDIEKTRIFGEVYYAWNKRLNFIIRVNSYGYKTNNEEKAWHMPAWDLTFSTHYNLRKKFLINLDIYGVGERYGAIIDDRKNPKKLKPYADVNLGIEYKYSKVLSGFINIYNLTASHYQRYYLYPMQRFKLMFGVTYAL